MNKDKQIQKLKEQIWALKKINKEQRVRNRKLLGFNKELLKLRKQIKEQKHKVDWYDQNFETIESRVNQRGYKEAKKSLLSKNGTYERK